MTSYLHLNLNLFTDKTKHTCLGVLPLTQKDQYSEFELKNPIRLKFEILTTRNVNL